IVLALQDDRSGLRSLWSIAHRQLRSVASGLVFFADASNELCQLSKMPQLLAPARGVRAAGGRQDVHPRAVEQLLLQAKFAFSLGKLFISEFPVKGHDVRSEFLELLREDDAAFGVVFAFQFLDAFRGTLHQVRKANAEFDHPLVVVVVKGLRHNAALVEHRPEFVPAARIVMANADGGLTRIAADDHELHAFAEMIGKCSHYASLLCPLILLLSPEVRSAHFDIGGRAFLGILTGKKVAAGDRAHCHSQIQFIVPERRRTANRGLRAEAIPPEVRWSKNSRARLY